MLNIIVAPYSHNSNAERIAKKVIKYLKSQQVEYSVYFSEYLENIDVNMRQLLSFGENEFVIVGDDAVINKVISCIKDLSKAKIGIIPTSARDDFARYLEISSNPIQAIKDILTKNIAKVDILVVNDMPVLNNVCVGASVDIYHHFSQYKIKNFISERIAMSKYGNKFAGIELGLTTKNKTKNEVVFDLVVANGGFAKGKPVSPLSNLQDGQFNVTYSTVSSRNEKKKYIRLQQKGEHVHDVETKQHWMTTLKITNPENKIKALIDGEIYTLEKLEISIIEKGLNIYKK